MGRSWVVEFKESAEAVRVEIENALKRRMSVVPVVLADAPVPKVAELPESMRPLLDLQAARLQRSFDGHADRFIDQYSHRRYHESLQNLSFTAIGLLNWQIC